MNRLVQTTQTADGDATFKSEHTRTHRRWTIAVLALYGIVVSTGIGATLIHRSVIVGAGHPAMQLQAKAQLP